MVLSSYPYYCNAHYSQVQHSDDVVAIPLMAFRYALPVDGLPIMHSWVVVLKDILFRGYEGWREIMEIKAVESPMPYGQPMDFHVFEVMKGNGRISMIMWAIVHTYTSLRQTMTPEEQTDFRRWRPLKPKGLEPQQRSTKYRNTLKCRVWGLDVLGGSNVMVRVGTSCWEGNP